VVGEALPVARTQRGGPADDRALRAQVLHQIPEGEALTDIVFRIELPPRVERVRAARDHLGGQRNIGGDDQVPGLQLLHDPGVGHVEALGYPEASDEGEGGVRSGVLATSVVMTWERSAAR
jgi:hypothetical protein